MKPVNNKNTASATTKVMTDIGLFMSTKCELEAGAVIVLNSFLKDGKPKFKVTTRMEKMKKVTNEDISFSSSDSNQFLYLSKEQFTTLVQNNRVNVSDDGQFLQIQVEAQIAPSELGSNVVTLEDLGMAS